MSNLLIHSMAEFSDIIFGCLDHVGAANIAEIGAEFGGMSQLLADHCAARGGTLTSIDPAPKAEFVAWAAGNASVEHIAAPSLEAISSLRDVDAWVIDGDHNYYTVSNELRHISDVAARDGKPLLAFLHDVSWPTARRDMYYDPTRIPAEHRHAFDPDGGVNLDTTALLKKRGFRGAGHFAFARQFGGPRNGVLTAVEDFIAGESARERNLAWVRIPAVFGLGILFDAAAAWAPELAAALLPYHENELLLKMEENRLRNYLAVIDWQDRFEDELESRMAKV